MRLIFFISAFILLGMSCLPCMDTLCEESEHGYELVLHQHEDDNEHQDHCSPLCFCSCCPGSPVYFIPGLVPFTPSPTLEITEIFTSFYVNPVQGISSTVWQPPRA